MSEFPRLFLAVLGVALLVTFACGTVMLAAAFWWPDPLTTTQQQAFETASKIFLVGAYSILGILGILGAVLEKATKARG